MFNIFPLFPGSEVCIGHCVFRHGESLQDRGAFAFWFLRNMKNLSIIFCLIDFPREKTVVINTLFTLTAW